MESASPASVSLSVSIVLHHSPVGIVQQTLQSLQQSVAGAIAAGALADARVMVVDNSLCDDYRREIENGLEGWLADGSLPWSYVQARSNGGYGAGHNIAIAQVESDYHLILNPDVELADSALLRGLQRLEADSTIALQSPAVRAESGAQEFLCKRYPTVLVLLLRAFAPGFLRRPFRRQLDWYEMRDQCAGSEAVEVMLASGCFMLVRTASLQAVGGFRDEYFLYFEDFDLSMRLAAQGRLEFNPAMRIIHHGGYAARKGSRHLRYFIRSGIRFFNNYGWRWI